MMPRKRRLRDPMRAKIHFAVSVLITTGLWSCKAPAPAHQHANEHVSGHDHHAAEHGHAGAAVHRVTGWGDDVEVFAEYTPHNQQASELLLYLTKLSDFTPYEGASLRVVWQRDSEKGGAIADEMQPGIYRAYLPSRTDAQLEIQIEIDGKSLAGLEWLAFRANEAAQNADDSHPGPHEDHHDQGEVELLKAQQWSVPFGTQRVTQASISETREVLAQVEIPSGSIAEVGAPVAGRVLEIGRAHV